MKTDLRGFSLELVDESGNRHIDVPGNKYVEMPDHWLPHIDEHRYKYAALYTLDQGQGHDIEYGPIYGVILRGSEGVIASRAIRASGAHLPLTEHSVAAVPDQFALAIGNRICCLAIPTLALRWSIRVDPVCCYAVYSSPDHMAFISHGELDIAKIDFAGNIVWTASGRDIFSGESAIFVNHLEVTDWNGAKYRIELKSGRVTIVKPEL